MSHLIDIYTSLSSSYPVLPSVFHSYDTLNLGDIPFQPSNLQLAFVERLLEWRWIAMAPDSVATRAGHGLAKVLGIKLHYRNPQGLDDLSRGESVYSVSSADTYVEHEPSTGEWLRSVVPSGRGLLLWAYNLFPFVHWIGRYNLQWMYGDLVAGRLLVSREELYCGMLTGC